MLSGRFSRDIGTIYFRVRCKNPQKYRSAMEDEGCEDRDVPYRSPHLGGGKFSGQVYRMETHRPQRVEDPKSPLSNSVQRPKSSSILPFIFKCSLHLIVCVFVFVYLKAHHGICVDVRGQFSEVSSLPPPLRIPGINSRLDLANAFTP